MSLNLGRTLASTALIGLLAGCSVPDSARTSPPASPTQSTATSISIDGSSTVYPLTNEVVQELQFELGDKAPAMEVAFSGTGGGFRKFCAGETDINNASRPISTAEIEACAANDIAYIELPVAFDALTVVVNENNDWASDITTEELKTIWEPAAEGKITRWNQVRADWPDRPLNLYGADVDSGTYDYFTEAIVGEAASSRTDYTDESDDERIVRAVRNDPDALGFFGLAYYEESRATLKALAIDNGQGPVEPSSDAVRQGDYQPLARPLFIYVNADRLTENPDLQALVQYYLTNVPFLTRAVGYTPLPTEAYAAVINRFDQRIIGTVFDGEAPSNLTLEGLIKLEQ